ncbi:MAG: hypothetical protein AAF074_14520 [Pseudomonadota bacterium]
MRPVRIIMALSTVGLAVMLFLIAMPDVAGRAALAAVMWLLLGSSIGADACRDAGGAWIEEDAKCELSIAAPQDRAHPPAIAGQPI